MRCCAQFTAIKNKNRSCQTMQGDQDTSNSLISAVRRGNLKITKELIDTFGLSYSQAWSEGFDLLCDALRCKHKKVAKLLLTNGSKVFNKNNCFNPNIPLHLAVINGYVEIVKMILDNGAYINAKNGFDASLLHISIENKKVAITELLLKHGADVNAMDDKGETPLRIAIRNRLEAVVKLLLQYGANVNTLDDPKPFYGCTPLHCAVELGQKIIVKLLINYKADINAKDSKGQTPIFYAIQNNDIQITRLLLNNGANIKDNPRLLNVPVLGGNMEIVDSDKQGRTALYLAAKDNIQAAIAKLLLSRGAKCSEESLNTAVINNNTGVVEALLEYNVKFEKKWCRTTPFLNSAWKGNEKICAMLLNKGVNVNAKVENGTTALHIATKNDHEEVVKLLLKNGANVDSKDKYGCTPLSLAVQYHRTEIIKTILKFGAYVNSRDKCGRTALHLASERGYQDAIIALLDHGSDINIMTNYNKTALDETEFVMRGLFWNLFGNQFGNPFGNPFGDLLNSCEKILKRHVIKMKTANLYLLERNLLSIRSEDKLEDFELECKEEIARMKCEKINNTNISFYDILTKATNSLAICMRNKNIVRGLKSKNFITKFPIYATMIQCNFRKGMERKEFAEQGNKIFDLRCNKVRKLPHDCTEKILSYLSNEDLKCLKNACESLHH